MSNMVERLRDWRSVHLARLHLLMEEAADEMERVQALADKRGELAVERRREIERLRQVSLQKNLTDAERFVLREARDAYADKDDVKCNEIAKVLDGLLNRTLGPVASDEDDR